MWKIASAVADLNNIYSNDIYASLCTYGVEMARASIVREMREVFKAYSIAVDQRHLELIADYMVNPSCISKDSGHSLLHFPDVRRWI